MTQVNNDWGTKGERIALAMQIQKVIRDTWSSPNPDNLIIGRDSYITKEKDVRAIARSILPSLSVKGMGKCDRALILLSLYLFMVEGAYASYMNFLCFMLVSQGHDLYNIFKREFAVSFKEIEDVNLETKEQFLKEHHLDLFKKGVKRQLRNSIAHYDFKIEKDGTVRVKGQIIDIIAELHQLFNFMGFLHGAAAKGLTQVQKMINHQSKTKVKRKK